LEATLNVIKTKAEVPLKESAAMKNARSLELLTKAIASQTTATAPPQTINQVFDSLQRFFEWLNVPSNIRTDLEPVLTFHDFFTEHATDNLIELKVPKLYAERIVGAARKYQPPAYGDRSNVREAVWMVA
jgi:hypothetical protein